MKIIRCWANFWSHWMFELRLMIDDYFVTTISKDPKSWILLHCFLVIFYLFSIPLIFISSITMYLNTKNPMIKKMRINAEIAPIKRSICMSFQYSGPVNPNTANPKIRMPTIRKIAIVRIQQQSSFIASDTLFLFQPTFSSVFKGILNLQTSQKLWYPSK